MLGGPPGSLRAEIAAIYFILIRVLEDEDLPSGTKVIILTDCQPALHALNKSDDELDGNDNKALITGMLTTNVTPAGLRYYNLLGCLLSN